LVCAFCFCYQFANRRASLAVLPDGSVAIADSYALLVATT